MKAFDRIENERVTCVVPHLMIPAVTGLGNGMTLIFCYTAQPCCVHKLLTLLYHRMAMHLP